MLSALVPGSYARANPRIELDEAVVVITGAGRGIGATAARAFAERGARVWVTDVDADVAEQVAASIGGRSLRLDVTDRDAWRAGVDEVLAAEGRIDFLVNNAGVMPTGPFVDEAAATTDLILDVNVKGVLNGMHAVLPSMVAAGRGHIVNIASMAGVLPLPGMVTYNASKYAAYGASLAARREYDGTGVTVSAILPSAVRTELASGADLGGALPTVDPEDVVRAILRTVRTRAARSSVPGWTLPGWLLADQFVPESVERVARELVNHGQALALDPVGRAAYLTRLGRQTREHAKENADV
ncbi:short-chain dehydrogenase [Gordonia phthalatica]|uniref:Short-chain dehydrogenase n=2 Tax=Gordonia phthalatica TaxID=1136941 RepID=A0A0N9NM24_9ACTN|nr:short-chain dehydrogenase [Gordonia phthalatica]